MPVNTLELARVLVNALEDKKAEDIILLNVQTQCSFADYFVVATGTSDRQLDALVTGLRETTRKSLRLKPPRIEGKAAGGWMVVDFGDVLVHLFSASQRRRYRLEELWGEGKVLVKIQ